MKYDSSIYSFTVAKNIHTCFLTSGQNKLKVEYNCFFAESRQAKRHRRNVILYAVWKRRMWVTAVTFVQKINTDYKKKTFLLKVVRKLSNPTNRIIIITILTCCALQTLVKIVIFSNIIHKSEHWDACTLTKVRGQGFPGGLRPSVCFGIKRTLR